MEMRQNVELASYTTFKVGGYADYFSEPTSIEELAEAIAFAQEKGLPVFVLGGGSNIVISDEGFRGLVIRLRIEDIEYKEHDEYVEVIVGAGYDWDAFVGNMVAQNLYGLENLSLIPGTVGASVVQNIGAYGMEVCDAVLWVEVFNSETKSIQRIENAECAFAYRNSVFKENKKYIVLRVAYKLKRNGVLNTKYKDVEEYFEQKKVSTPTLQNLREAIVAIRTQKLPDLNVYGTAGSFFKNPVVTEEKYQELKSTYPDIPSYTLDNGLVKLPLGWILEHVCRLKGVTEGSVGTYDKQALVIVNKKDATANEIKKFAEKIAQRVRGKTGIEIEREVEYISVT